jgi:hypothetical protein
MNTKLAVAAAVAVATVVNLDRVWIAPLLAQDRAATLLTQVRTALGGEQKLAAVKAISAEGPSRRAMGARSVEGSVTLLLVRPDKLRRSEESRLLGSATERISTFDGTQAWDETVSAAGVGAGHGGFDHSGGFDHGSAGSGATGDHGGWDHGQEFGHHDQTESGGADGPLTPEQVNAARVRRMKMELQRWTIALLADSSQPFTDAGRAESPDGPADVLETKDEAGRAVRYFIDPASHMPLMVQYQEVRPQAAASAAAGLHNDSDAVRRRVEDLRAQGAPKTATVAMHLAGYKKVDGVLLPHQIDISIDGRASEAWTIDAFKINPKVKANAFQRPTR